MITVFVSIILFEGGLSLNLSQIRILKGTIVKQIVINIGITMLAGYLAAYYIAGLSRELSLVFASLAGVTGPTVIKPIIRHLPLGPNVKTLLNGESVLIDPIGAVLAIIALEFVITKTFVGTSIVNFLLSIGVGLLAGSAFGLTTKFILCRTRLLPAESHSIFLLGILFLTSFTAEMAAPESGLMAVTVLGVILGTIDYRIKSKIMHFNDQISKIIISLLFILLSAHFNIGYLSNYAFKGLAIVAVLVLVRFPVVLMSTRGGPFSMREKLFVGWIGPRGIVALAVASIAAIKLEAAGIMGARLVEIMVFILISVTVILQGLSAGLLAKRLNILMKGDGNLVILGVNAVTLALAGFWVGQGKSVLFIDSNPDNCLDASRAGFACREGNCFDTATYEGFEIDYFSSALGASPNNEINILFCRFMKDTYGLQNLYSVGNERSSKELAEIIVAENIRIAFGGAVEREMAGGSLISRFLGYLKIARPTAEIFAVAEDSLHGDESAWMPLHERAVILAVKREGNEFHLFHDGFKFRKNDSLLLYFNERDLPEIRDFFDRPT